MSSWVDKIILRPHNASMNTSRAIKLAGGKAKLADIAGVTRQAVTRWVAQKTLPPLRVFQLRELRPDWFKK